MGQCGFPRGRAELSRRLRPSRHGHDRRHKQLVVVVQVLQRVVAQVVQ